MKKITRLFSSVFYLVTLVSLGQTYTTGVIQLSTAPGLEYSVQIDVTSAQVTLTTTSPSNRWFGLSFDTNNMIAGKDAVIYQDTGFSDRYHGYPGQPEGEDSQGFEPSIDDRQDWTVVSNVVNSGVRTLVATRDRDTGNDNDYVFSASATSIDLIWARGRFDDENHIAYHGGPGEGNRGFTMQSFTLSTDKFEINDFKIIPNPATTKFTVSLPGIINNISIEVFDVLGKKIFKKTSSGMSSTIDVSKWNNGVYLVRVSTDEGIQTKRFVKQ